MSKEAYNEGADDGTARVLVDKGVAHPEAYETFIQAILICIRDTGPTYETTAIQADAMET